MNPDWEELVAMNPPTPSCEWSLRRSDGREIVFFVDVGQRVILGCDLGVDIPVLEAGVAHHHAAFEYEGENLVLSDLESLNGTLVNAVPIDSAPVRAGDVITVGGVSLVLGQREPDSTCTDTSRALHHLSREELLRLAEGARELSGRRGDDIEHRLLSVAVRLVDAERGVVFLYDSTTQLRAAAVLPEHFHGAIARLTASLGASVSVSSRGQLLDVGHAAAWPLPAQRGILYVERSDNAFETSSLNLLRALLWISAPSLTGRASAGDEDTRQTPEKTQHEGTTEIVSLSTEG